MEWRDVVPLVFLFLLMDLAIAILIVAVAWALGTFTSLPALFVRAHLRKIQALQKRVAEIEEHADWRR